MTVRFIRAEDVEGSGKNDDRAVITSVDDNVYNLTYTFGNCKKRPIVKEAILDYEGVVGWFNRTLRFVDADYVPFARYQFDFSLMPSIMIAHQELHHHHKTIMNAVRFHLNNWVTEDDFEFSEEDEDDECEEEAPVANTLPHPDTIDWGKWFANDQYESNAVNNCCDDDHSSLSSDDYAPPQNKHKFFNEENGKETSNQVKNMVQKMEQKAKSATSNLRR